MDDSGTAVLAGLDGIRGGVEDFYRDLHANPELGFQEHRTAAKVAEALRRAGCEVTEGIGGTGVVGVLSRGRGPAVLLRADMDALPLREDTGLPYSSEVTATDAEGAEQPVMHACGHDVHVACLLGFAQLMARATDAWSGTVIALFQPSEETGGGARAMLADDLAGKIPKPDVALAQHVLPYPAGYVGTRSGSFLSAADSLRVTFHGRGAHGSAPQSGIDPVIMAAMTAVRLQTVVSREVAATTPAVLTVGSIQAGQSSNVIPDRATMQLSVRTYDPAVREQVLASIERIVRAEAEASGAPAEPEFERLADFPATVNDAATTETVARAFAAHFGDDAHTIDLQTASEDMSEIPQAFGIPYTYWGIGGTDPAEYARAQRRGTAAQDIPSNHSPHFAPVPQPTLDTGIRALTTAALAWLARDPGTGESRSAESAAS
ncbi:amidohydrolase [Saccharopolyspora sp. SCSIO 74807]|uniref:amidohydrolase n=1 Tax=Saccharopolyspora sp. SCSIO 74807 TaxID=3118084 RepID=UPI0030D0F1C2